MARLLVAWPESTQGFRPFTEAPRNWPALAIFNQRIADILNQPIPIDDDGELRYAALQQLCSSLLEYSDRLPEPQRDALDVAFGRSAGQAPSRSSTWAGTRGTCASAACTYSLIQVRRLERYSTSCLVLGRFCFMSSESCAPRGISLTDSGCLRRSGGLHKDPLHAAAGDMFVRSSA